TPLPTTRCARGREGNFLRVVPLITGSSSNKNQSACIAARRAPARRYCVACGEDVVARAPGLLMRHGIERDRLGKARIDVAAAAGVAQAASEMTAPPQFERVTVSLLLPRLLRREPRRIVQLCRERGGCRFGHGAVSSVASRLAKREGARFCSFSPLAG